jgi:hypothetical protein
MLEAYLSDGATDAGKNRDGGKGSPLLGSPDGVRNRRQNSSGSQADGKRRLDTRREGES